MDREIISDSLDNLKMYADLLLVCGNSADELKRSTLSKIGLQLMDCIENLENQFSVM